MLGFLWLRERWFVAAGMFWAIELLFFTTFLTNGQGIGTGLIGSLGYWIDQQEVMRGGQPWYYFYLIVPLYEFLPLILSSIGAVAAVALAGPSRPRAGSAGGASPARRATGGRQAAEMPAMGAQKSRRSGRSGCSGDAVRTRARRRFQSRRSSWRSWSSGRRPPGLIFTYVGEKMPWHTVYFAMSMAPLAGWWLGG